MSLKNKDNVKVKYKNEFNLIALKDFNSKEMDLFFSICSKMNGCGTASITFSFKELRELSNYKMTASKKFISDIEQVHIKLLNLKYRHENECEISSFILFTGYNINKIKKEVTITVNPQLSYIINDLKREFTLFELQEFISIKSSYAKTAYRLLKQFKSTGFYKVSIDSFRELLDVPQSYSISKIDEKVLGKIKVELSPLFSNLRIKKIKEKGKNKIAFIEFIFDPNI